MQNLSYCMCVFVASILLLACTIIGIMQCTFHVKFESCNAYVEYNEM